MARSDAARKPKPEDVKKRVEAANAKWDMWRGLYDSCYTFAAPQRNLFGGQAAAGVQGHASMNNVFDSTAISSLDRFANRVQANVFPPQKKWGRLQCGSAIPDEKRDEVQRALEKINDEAFAVMRSSNFDIAIGESLHDLGVGTMALCIQPGDAAEPINYTAVSPAVVRFEEDEYGRPCNVFRTIRVKPELIERLWKGAKLNDTLKSAKENKPHEEIDLIESTIKDLDTGRYHYQIIHPEGNHEVYWRSQKYTNWVIARYSKLAGELLGRGPVVSALPDIKTLNKVKEFILKNAAIAISGLWTARDDGVLNPNNIEIKPGLVLGVASNGGPQGPSLQALKTGADFNVGQLIINDLVMSIKRIMLDESLPPDTASARSATEIIERMKELAQNMGSAFGRLIDEVLIPIMEITLAVLDERGVIRFPLKLDGREVKAVAVAPLAMAQNLDEVEQIFQYAQMATLLGAEGATAINETEALDYVGDAMGVPHKIRRNREERKQKMEETAKAQSAAMVAQVASEAAVKGAGKTPPPAANPMGMLQEAA